MKRLTGKFDPVGGREIKLGSASKLDLLPA